MRYSHLWANILSAGKALEKITEVSSRGFHKATDIVFLS